MKTKKGEAPTAPNQFQAMGTRIRRLRGVLNSLQGLSQIFTLVLCVTRRMAPMPKDNKQVTMEVTCTIDLWNVTQYSNRLRTL